MKALIKFILILSCRAISLERSLFFLNPLEGCRLHPCSILLLNRNIRWGFSGFWGREKEGISKDGGSSGGSKVIWEVGFRCC